jgi:peptidoglycan/xylan/chitin deacetylase (PgdA/CDA1 family)
MKKYLEYAISKLVSSLGGLAGSSLTSILMLHKVGTRDAANLPVYEGNRVAPEFLDSFLVECKKRAYSFIGIDEMISMLMTGKNNKRVMVLSIDDGYKDTFTNAYPILTAHNIPFVFYVSTSFPDKKALVWWDTVHYLVMNHDEISLNDGRTIPSATVQQKTRAYVYLSKLILRMGSKARQRLPVLLCKYNVENVDKDRSSLIDWSDIVGMSKNELCTIGAHTVNHYGLRYEKAEHVLRDFVSSREILERKIGKTVAHLAYPYGTAYSVGFREGTLARKAGFVSAATTFPGKIYPFHKRIPMFLPRVPLVQIEDEPIHMKLILD